MRKRKTHDKYVAELAIKNPNVEVVGKYIDARTKILHYCKIHKIKWDISPDSTLSGRGCPECRLDKIKNSKQKTNETYISELTIKNPNLEVIDDYIDVKTKILHRCRRHDFKWLITPSDALKGHGCKFCKSENIKLKNLKTHEWYVNELKLINPNIIPLESYNGMNNHILHKCLIDNYEWNAMPNNILKGNCGCPKCSQRFRRTNDDYINELQEKYPHIIALEEFQGMQIPILHLCTKHNIEWKAVPDNILKGCGCSECGREKITEKNTMSYEQYIMRLNDINPNIIVTGNYINATTKVEHTCLVCNKPWITVPSYILQGKGCPRCRISKGEYQISKWLDIHNIKYETQYKFQDCKDQRVLPFDFYIPTYHRLIEYDGEQHFRPIDFWGGQEGFEIRQKHDNIKNEYCKNNGIPLLRIPYDKNIEEELNNFLFN